MASNPTKMKSRADDGEPAPNSSFSMDTGQQMNKLLPEEFVVWFILAVSCKVPISIDTLAPSPATLAQVALGPKNPNPVLGIKVDR